MPSTTIVSVIRSCSEASDPKLKDRCRGTLLPLSYIHIIKSRSLTTAPCTGDAKSADIFRSHDLKKQLKHLDTHIVPQLLTSTTDKAQCCKLNSSLGYPFDDTRANAAHPYDLAFEDRIQHGRKTSFTTPLLPCANTPRLKHVYKLGTYYCKRINQERPDHRNTRAVRRRPLARRRAGQNANIHERSWQICSWPLLIQVDGSSCQKLKTARLIITTCMRYLQSRWDYNQRMPMRNQLYHP